VNSGLSKNDSHIETKEPKMKKLLIATLLATSLGGGLALAPAANADVVVVRVAPPPPRDEVVPPARDGYVWTPGYWRWNGHRHVWVSGKYVRARHGYHWREPVWAQVDHGRWRLERGRWERGDNDHDGVPNRLDEHPNNPNRY
jgi:hypothetical protein